MKTNLTKALNYSLGGAVCAGALILAANASAQNLFVSDLYANNIYQYTPGGVQSTFATGMNFPFGIAFNANGDLFVANCENDGGAGYVTKITRGGVQSTIPSGSDPKALAFNSAGDLFEADYHSGNIYKYSGGTLSIFATVPAAPQAMTINSAGDLFVGSGYGAGVESITEITPNGTESTFATGLSFIGGLAFNGAGNLLVAQETTGTILQYTPGGVQSVYATVNASGLNAIAFDGAGNLFAETGPTIVKIAPGGGQSIFAAGLNNAAGLAFQPVPEPSTFALIGIGAAAAFFARRRR